MRCATRGFVVEVLRTWFHTEKIERIAVKVVGKDKGASRGPCCGDNATLRGPWLAPAAHQDIERKVFASGLGFCVFLFKGLLCQQVLLKFRLYDIDDNQNKQNKVKRGLGHWFDFVSE